MHPKFIAASLFILICILPGSKAGFYDGLPLSAIETGFSFFILLGIFSTPWEKNKNLKISVFLTLILLLLFQAAFYKSLPYGWKVCMHGEISKSSLKSACEPSIEDSSGKNGSTYTRIAFTSDNMPLYFLNNLSFNFFKSSQPSRDSLPFTMKASSYIHPQKEDYLYIKSNRDVFIKINNKEYAYTSYNKEERFPLEPLKDNFIQAQYSSDVSRKNSFYLRTENSQAFYRSTTSPIQLYVYRTLNYLLLMILFIFFVYSFIIYSSNLDKKNKLFILILSFFLFFLFIFAISDIALYFHLIILALSLAFIIAQKSARKILLPLAFLIIFAASCVTVLYKVPPEKSILFSGGNDELTHEAFSRGFFSATNFQEFMQASESSLFYFQPLHRYFLFLFHKFFGEPMWGIYVTQTFLFGLGIFLTIYALRKSIGQLSAFSFSVLYFALFAWHTTSIVKLFQSPLQQALALPLLIIGISLVTLMIKTKRQNKIICLGIGLILGAVFMVRTDWISVIFVTLSFSIYILWNNINAPKSQKISLLFLGFIVFPLFVGFRNYYIAKEFTILPTSGYVNLLGQLKDPISTRVNFHESSGIKIIKEILTSFSGRYLQLSRILWDNINQNIIGKALWKKSLWATTLSLAILSLMIPLKQKKYKRFFRQTFLCSAIFLLALSGSLFEQHNGIAMLAIYDYLAILVLALSIQTVFDSWKELDVKYQNYSLDFNKSIKNIFTKIKLIKNGIFN